MNEIETKIKRNNILKELLSACEQAGLTPFVKENPTDAGSIENPPIALARLAPLPIENIPLTDDMTQEMKTRQTVKEKQNERMRENNLREQQFQQTIRQIKATFSNAISGTLKVHCRSLLSTLQSKH